MPYKLLLGMNFLNQMVSVYWETIHCLFTLNASYISHFTGFGNFSFNFHVVGVVNRDLTKFKDCGFLHARNSVCKTFKITF